MTQNQQKITRERRKALRGRLNRLLGPHQRTLQIASFLAWIQFVMRILSFALIAQALAQFYHKQAVQVPLFIMQLAVLNIIGFTVALLARNYQGVASQYARNQLKHQFFDVFRQRQGEFDSQVSVADVLTVASQGIDSLDTYYSLYKMISLRAFANCATVLAIVAFLFPVGGLVFLLSLPFIPVSILLIQKRSKEIMQRYWASYMDVGNLFIDDLKGMNTLYSYGADERYEQSFVAQAEHFRQVTMDLLRFQLQSVGYMDAVMYLGVGVSGFFAVQSWFAGELSLFHIVFFVLIAAEFFAPIRELGYCMHLLMMNTKMADRIFGFLDLASLQKSTVADSETEGIQQISQVSVHEVHFSYEEKPILQGISAVMKKGSIFAIAGESGRGKTTLARLLLGYEMPTAGEIRFDQQSMMDLTKESLSQMLVYVSPSSYVFNTSIYENLVMGTSFSRQEVEEWMALQGVLTFVQELPEGLDTIAGENGAHLSPGQRQQIICARALLSKRAVYIFDEMTSSIDSENEQAIFDLIRLTAEDAIVIFISHKMKQVLQADQVLFMDQGYQTQLGTPDELLASNEAFKQLAQTQAELEAMLYVN
ncbi:ABC transporter ATP-binding protein/permease [Aerococcaceae bacterium NML201209]|nr:ABC transporter ATP-binding protein/permease [Aerococcaceae bacterium NML201209]